MALRMAEVLAGEGAAGQLEAAITQLLQETTNSQLPHTLLLALPPWTLKAVHLLGYLREVVQLQLMGHDLGEVMVLLPAALRSFHQTRAQIQRPEEALARHPR